jgi:hypothetical protein
MEIHKEVKKVIFDNFPKHLIEFHRKSIRT